MDYKALLIKYLTHIFDNEGITFVEQSDEYPDAAFTEEEWQELNSFSAKLLAKQEIADDTEEGLT